MTSTITSSQKANVSYKIDTQQQAKIKKSEGEISIVPSIEIQKTDSLVIKGTTDSANTYSKNGYKLSTEELSSINGQQQQNLMHLKNMVRQLISKQNNQTIDSGNSGLNIEEVLSYGDTNPSVGSTVSKVNSIVGTKSGLTDDFSVEAVSNRIVDFAISISGGDKEKLDQLKASIEEGFKQARQAFSKELPEISKQTHDAIMQKLDDWGKEE